MEFNQDDDSSATQVPHLKRRSMLTAVAAVSTFAGSTMSSVFSAPNAVAADTTSATDLTGRVAALESEMVPTINTLTAGTSLFPPFYSGLMLCRPDLGNGIVCGANAEWGPLLTNPSDGLVYDYQYTALVTGQSPPAGAFVNTINSARMSINRFKGFYYGVFGMPNNQWSVYRTVPTTPYTWSKVLDLTTDGTSTGASTAFSTCMDYNATYLFVSEYGDPKVGGKQAPHLWRSKDGSTWDSVYTGDFRHIHAVACDPFNEGHVYLTTGDGDAPARLLRSTDNGATWTTLFSGAAIFQSVQISFSKNYIWLASDADGISAIVVNRATGIPKIAAHNSHLNIAVPGGAPGDKFFSQAIFGAFDGVTQKYYFVATHAGRCGNRYGVFYLEKIGGLVQLLTALPDDFVASKVQFFSEGDRRIMYSGNLRIEITDRFAPESQP